MLTEIRKEYPKFKDFWDKVLEQTREGKNSVYLAENPSPLHVVRLFASQLTSIKHLTGVYVSELEENEKAEMPVKTYQDCMSILQKAMGEASDIYYGENEILDKEGRLISQFNKQ